MKLVLVRHGETKENKKEIIQGCLHGELTEKGISQARKLGEKLKKEKIDYIFCSDLKRSLNTAEEILKYHPDSELVIKEELRERHWGNYQGVKKSEIPEWNKKEFSLNQLNKEESLENLYKRAKKFLDYLLENYNDRTVVVVGHIWINRALTAVIHNKGHEEMINIKGQENTEVKIFEI